MRRIAASSVANAQEPACQKLGVVHMPPLGDPFPATRARHGRSARFTAQRGRGAGLGDGARRNSHAKRLLQSDLRVPNNLRAHEAAPRDVLASTGCKPATALSATALAGALARIVDSDAAVADHGSACAAAHVHVCGWSPCLYAGRVWQWSDAHIVVAWLHPAYCQQADSDPS